MPICFPERPIILERMRLTDREVYRVGWSVPPNINGFTIIPLPDGRWQPLAMEPSRWMALDSSRGISIPIPSAAGKNQWSLYPKRDDTIIEIVFTLLSPILPFVWIYTTSFIQVLPAHTTRIQSSSDGFIWVSEARSLDRKLSTTGRIPPSQILHPQQFLSLQTLRRFRGTVSDFYRMVRYGSFQFSLPTTGHTEVAHCKLYS